MTIFATVNAHNYLGRGVEYANVLYDMVTRNLKDGTKGRFIVFTDEPFTQGYSKGIELKGLPSGLDGWWNKLALFAADAFPHGERVVFFDLDTVITGSLDEIAVYSGAFAILRDVYRPSGLQSSVMVWEAGKANQIWDKWLQYGKPKFAGGDQAWIEIVMKYPVILQQQFPDRFVSYKRDARFGIPPKASVVFFHGLPRPHECDGWVKHVWKVGGGTSAQLELIGNVDGETIKANIRRAENDPGASWLMPVPEHNHVAVICAGGPSLKDETASILAHSQSGAHVFACNGAPRLLKQFGISTDFHVIVDGRAENAQFVENIGPATVCFYASTCDESVTRAAADRLVYWHPAFDGILDISGADRERCYIGGGTTCGMKAATIAWTLGYREIHLYGFDSCYRDGEHHAYPQSLNDSEQVLDAEFNDKSYKCAPWMIQQAEDFEVFAPQLMDHGTRLHVHGTGLIPDIAAQFSQGLYRPEAADFRALAILERLQEIEKPRVAEVGVFAGDLSRRLLARRSDLDLTMIDSWTVSRETYAKTKDFHASMSQQAQDQFYELTKRVTSFANGRAHIIRDDSKAAAIRIPDNSLDMAFIDADHSYEGCKSDIETYWPKVKPGGFISGHDYGNDDWLFGPMVKRAVDEFAESHNLTLELGENWTWFARRPHE